MADPVTLTHPALPGREITVSESTANVRSKSGWVRTPTPAAVDPGATVKQIRAEVGDDPAKAASALEAERNGAKRTSLIAHLEAVVAAGAPASDPTNTESPDQGTDNQES